MDGWDAFQIDQTVTDYNRGIPKIRKIESYIVIECPQFVMDDRFAKEFSAWSKRKAIVLAKKKRREQRKRK